MDIIFACYQGHRDFAVNSATAKMHIPQNNILLQVRRVVVFVGLCIPKWVSKLGGGVCCSTT